MGEQKLNLVNSWMDHRTECGANSLWKCFQQGFQGTSLFLAPRFNDVIGALSVHQALPAVTEIVLYDFLASLILRAMFRIDVNRCAIEPNSYSEAVLDHQVKKTQNNFNISDDELQILDAMFCPKP